MGYDTNTILENILIEVDFLSYGGRIAFMVNNKGSLWYLVKCCMCKNISLHDYMHKIDDIKYYECQFCIALQIKNKEIYGKIDCNSCKKEVNFELEGPWEETAKWFCDECIELPNIQKQLYEGKIAQEELNKKYAEKVINFF